ncbi:MAG: ankyrin repeat domain-containing protein [Pseudomonadota bacterium]|nr:ankyrin repeat domain-containing protein [Pseudomonadota bacterium]
MACFNGHVDIARVLLKKDRIEPNTTNDSGCSTLEAAIFSGNKDMLLMLLRDSRVNRLTPEEISQFPRDKERQYYIKVYEERCKRLFRG